ncbi:deoxyribodipyrimidine photo-lyase [Methanohalophilus portucalensis]|uniref:Deoxyribodipyrimidine photo-lyase n=2 Tax=Methanohalophilus portucalensis TaxID=39664 RepID=A0A1L9C614_9EURY|nr:deoxyribodipyrimidine photo-lyase [Methanohalophilus portucalensis]ATU08545.1 deoxyribodipyrimidine photolyase [Methanohalophilus portucalensis]OJH49906.1 deoxyribodipyrimidine photo-lyase type II [Methanohalophilus portucalensis FDF-1]RNI13283.1 deoxyribodipyrimidine photo-lyase [Methanohalophilus portucalensis FDF-1]SMH32921.1 Deoxyribodipyrimidine photo-lyase type II [Methanohalophilus portucalensis FDF-1]
MPNTGRIHWLNEKPVVRGTYVLYWMQSSQRVDYNHALEFAIQQANEMDLPLLVLFCLTEYPEANLRHYTFMFEGLVQTKESLEELGVQFVMLKGNPVDVVHEFARDASLLITDQDYQKLQRRWRVNLAESISCPFAQVESNVIVPVETVSDKEEWSAATLRKKIHKHLDEFMHPFELSTLANSSFSIDVDSLDPNDFEQILESMDIGMNVEPSAVYKGGIHQARKKLSDFISGRLGDYAEKRNDPNLDFLSGMSPYLHFGQISPLEIALKVQDAKGYGSTAYMEELVVRRELAMNFVYYDQDYDSLRCLPNWAKKTLAEHRDDFRQYVYTLEEFEQARTHDPYWNAAQKEMVLTGKMHGYMRMYWGKKILEWTEGPEDAYQIALYLNNKYELDGRDPNGYAGIAWCFGKHDRAWKEREVFGKVRYMNANGLKRKFDADGYVEKIANLEEKLG